ncbi:minor capsid protein [Roseateles sp. DAIF2]|uniref:phage minor head protein n=1 Tax=Roseateles sp. DAIF2 TaxID=2714952 RepID=UPI0018A330A7|nr:phage minor head protein [Roseateles sp. DAIF2]QPF74229.1 minor capsid protein [Roseateles sp. DAIF2]
MGDDLTPQEFARLQAVRPEEAAAYLQGRGRLAITYGWQDRWHEEHAHQFTISRLTRADLLASLQDMLAKSVDGDLSRRDFNRDAKALLQKAGWWGTTEVVDPATGEILKTRFDARRLKLIFDTNTRQAYAAGQWERLQQTKRTHPYLRYITKRDERVRATHRAWDNVTLPVDDSFWNAHYPPNGWHCRCRVVAVSQADYDKGTAPGGQPMNKVAPEVVRRPWLNRRTDEVHQVPAGVDPGFGYNAGKASIRAKQLRQLAQGKLAQLSPDMARAVRRAGLGLPDLDREAALDFVSQVQTQPSAKQPPMVLGTLEASAAKAAQELGLDIGDKVLALDHDGVRHALAQHGDERERLRGQIPVTADDLAQFGALFNRANLEPGDPPLSKDGSKMLLAIVKSEGIEYRMAVKVRRNDLVLQTMYKLPAK